MSNISVTASQTAASASAPAAQAAPAAARFNQAGFVYSVDLVILVVLAVFVLFVLPQAFARYAHRPEWFQGLLLRSKKIDAHAKSNKQTSISAPSRAYFDPITGRSFYTDKDFENTSDEGHFPAATLQRNKSSGSAHVNLLRNTSTSSGRVRRTQGKLPSHMPGWSSMLPWVSQCAHTTILPGVTVGKAVLALAYTTGMIYATLYKSNLFTESIRTGFLAASQIPVVIILGTKNNIPGWLLGMSYERLNFLHRYAGRLTVLAANLHVLGYIYAWAIAGTLTQHLQVLHYQAGLIAVMSFNVLFLFSTSLVRTKFFNIFIITHILAVIALLATICLHASEAVPYVVIAASAYGLDRVLRLVKTRYAHAYLTPLPSLGMTKIEIPALNAGWRAGQHVRIRVLSTGMGWFGWSEVHPFTIASVCKNPNDEGLVLMCKKAGGWTDKLFNLAKKISHGEAGGHVSAVNVLVEGPYGGPGHTLFSSFSGALFVAGGSGITFALGAVQDLVNKDLSGETRLKAIELVWVIQDPSMLMPLIPMFTEILSQRTHATVRISVHYTKAGDPQTVMKAFSRITLPRDLTLHAGRPKLAQSLAGVVDQACSLSMFMSEYRKSGSGSSAGGPSGVIVGVCGPTGLAESVKKVVGDLDSNRRKEVGGVEIHSESFGV
ncbi:hypothetical protein QCA50_005605 [Cerrena zonata]|uniref:ferric-chelate reductase (NADPH) n=1 Tax=Cerrena zonata TaxID=2478898 RepID=A0AAW0GKR1_9APHY